jgi:cytochrome P450
VQARDADDRLSEEELVGLAVQLLPAGYETTASEIANFVFVLLCHPDQLEMLRGRPDLIPTAVEELLRYVPLTSGNTLPRYATEAVELSGGAVPAGSWVLFSVEAADRDPRVFTEPDRLDLTRSPNPHMAFGVGQHTCLGAHLARMELQVALGSLLRRLPGLRLAVDPGDLRWKMGTTVQGPVALPVAW